MAQDPTVVAVADTPTLLWQTSTGVFPDPLTTAEGNDTEQIFRASGPTDPVPIIIQNIGDADVTLTNADGSFGSGTDLPVGASITRNVVGNDSEYGVCETGTVDVSVQVGRQ